MKVPTLLSLVGSIGFLPSLTSAAAYKTVTTPFGPNPRNVSFNIYVPDKLAAHPPVLVYPHWCHGLPEQAFEWSRWSAIADDHGFIVIYPGSPNAADQCWDVSSKETLTHNGGGDSLGIVSMVRWTLEKYKGDKSRVFVAGISSGAMMTQVLLGAYPDVFAAGASFAGVPFGCFAPANNAGQYDFWSNDCATGQVKHTGKEWADIVRAGFPGYNGWRPKLQIYQGTEDQVLNYTNFGESIKEWTSVNKISDKPVKVVADTPLPGWTKSIYGPSGWVESYSALGVTHDIKLQEDVVLGMFQLNCTKNCFAWGKGRPTKSC